MTMTLFIGYIVCLFVYFIVIIIFIIIIIS